MSGVVAINGRAAVRRELGGVERVATELIRHLLALDPNRYRVIAPRPALAHRAGHAWEQLVLPALARDCALVLSPAHTAPLHGPPGVVLVNDVAPFVGDWYSTAYSRWHRFLLPRVARRAQLVITPSETMQAEVARHLGVELERVAAVPLGVDPRFSSPANPEAVRRQLGLERPYVLAVGTDIPRKNLALVDRVAPALDEEGFDAVLAGSGRSYMPSGRYRTRSLGYVADAHLPGLYQGASALMMPSLYEGFGLPCLEAMAAGTPVVSSDRGALPETCGDAAILVDPEDIEGFASAVLRAATPGPERDRMVARGRERAARFTWQRTAEGVDGLLDSLLPAP